MGWPDRRHRSARPGSVKRRKAARHPTHAAWTGFVKAVTGFVNL
ncbi:hypothetical protein MPEAHAMD_6155 [Methylobacterium frigidaeris]|uniref:Uncharacterized protein n=1 Tax=Methylobacterium frigidaeris TaxID=2038277 RepID=A0AA37HI17_9HYPH|nr:hypothetical protein MPEAHAMD_6155 [Methylobacterium frigidaeris]